MASVPIEALPRDARMACERLRERLPDILGENLVALWAYGAATFADRPKRLGDLDTHGILATPPDRETAEQIDAIHDAIARDCGIEWDSWYILEQDATEARPPSHAFRNGLGDGIVDGIGNGIVDGAWALHRAHWLAGQYVALHGCAPATLVRRPSWEEMLAALRSELHFMERLLAEGRTDAGHAAYAVWNSCRILYSVETRDVVISKSAAARWALDHLSRDHHRAIRAARRVYEGADQPDDAHVLAAAMPAIIEVVRARFE